MQLDSHKHGEFTVITLDGSLDSSTSPAVQSDLERLIPAGGTTVLDFGKITYMSSSGLRVLLLTHRRAQENGSRIVLIKLSADVREVMSVTGFLDYFEIADTEVLA